MSNLSRESSRGRPARRAGDYLRQPGRARCSQRADLLERVEEAIRVRSLFRKGERILMAISGGLDSVVLLHVLQELAPINKWRLSVVHLNHCLRGRSSDADERLVRSICKKF